MLEIYESSAFKRDRKRESRNPKHKDVDLSIVEALQLLYTTGALPPRFRLHRLKGSYVGFLECHIKPDLLMVFRLNNNVAFLYRLGSHSELFK